MTRNDLRIGQHMVNNEEVSDVFSSINKFPVRLPFQRWWQKNSLVVDISGCFFRVPSFPPLPPKSGLVWL